MPTYSLQDIVGKNLTAIAPVKVYRFGNYTDAVYTVQPGQPVGILYSYLNQTAQHPLLFMFYDANNKPYYTKAGQGMYKLNANSGVLSLEEKEEQAQEQNETTADKIINGVKKLVLIGGLFYLGSTFIKAKVK